MLMNWTIRVAFCTRFALLVVGGHLDSGDSNDILHEFSRRFEDLERKVAEQSALIARQTEQLREQSEAMTNLKNVVEVQDDTITELKHLVEMQQQQQQQQQQKQKQQGSQQQWQQNFKDLVKRQVSEPKISSRFVVDNYETVAFHATVTGTIGHIDINQTLVFNSVKLNIGGGYHASGGIFIAPISGIYIFSTSVTFNNNQDESHMIIEKNGVEIAGAYGNARNGLHEQGSVTVVMELKVGDEVYVSNQRHHDVIVYGDNLSSFMGCLILQV